MAEILRRAASLRADAETGTVEGIAVPWNTPISVGGIREQFARGAIDTEDAKKAKLFWQHGEIIGRVVDGEDREDGYHIVAQISDTVQGRDARTLIKDGAIDSFSVGFIPVEDREEQDGTITRAKVQLREVSAVTWPAYQDAKITGIRSDADSTTSAERQDTMPTGTVTVTDLAEVRDSIEELTRRVETLPTERDEEPAIDTRSAGEILKALVARDETTTNRVNGIMQRAYTGGTSADSVVNGNTWVGDLTRIFDNASGALASVFGSATLPATGLTLEYGELDTNTIQFTEQAAEGDTLAFGKVSLTTKTAAVKTYGGYTTLSVQEIERSSLPILNRSLQAMTIAAAQRAKAVLRTTYGDAVTAQSGSALSLGATLAAAKYADWSSATVDAAAAFNTIGLPITALIVSKSVFKALGALEDSAGRPIFDRTGTGVNSGGTVSLVGLTGNLAGVQVIADVDASGDTAAFVNAAAITAYLSPIVNLQDASVVNLTRDFSAYRYGAVATEVPGAIIPVTFAAE